MVVTDSLIRGKVVRQSEATTHSGSATIGDLNLRTHDDNAIILVSKPWR